MCDQWEVTSIGANSTLAILSVLAKSVQQQQLTMNAVTDQSSSVPADEKSWLSMKALTSGRSLKAVLRSTATRLAYSAGHRTWLCAAVT